MVNRFPLPARRVAAPAAALVALCCAVTAAPLSATATSGRADGPTSSAAPYMVSTADGVTLQSILTAGDVVEGYAMAGTPDGLGAFDNGDGTFTTVVNHEFAAPTEGTPRSHGNQTGAFVSRWVVDKDTLKVVQGSDQIQHLVLTSGGSNDISRLCSADLAPLSAFYNSATGKGFNAHIFLNGEEAGATGRAFANVVSGGYNGFTYELPDVGKAAWENLAASPATGDRTVIVGQSDGGNGGVYVYAGDKSSTGGPLVRAGLTGGTSARIAVTGMPTEDSTVPDDGTVRRFTLDEASATAFDRPEDGAWDVLDPNVYYFATTASTTKHSRIWKVTFDDASQPELGGDIEVLAEGPALAADADPTTSEGPLMMDNLTVAPGGFLLVQEDPGSSTYLSGIFSVDPRTGEFERVAQHSAQYFTETGSDFITTNEESSGIIPAPFLGPDAFLLADQIHKAVADPAQVEMGQLLRMDVPLPDVTPVGPAKVKITLKGINASSGKDTLKADAPSIAAGAQVEFFRVKGNKMTKVADGALNGKGDLTATVKDLNGKDTTTYVVRLLPNDAVKAAVSNKVDVK